MTQASINVIRIHVLLSEGWAWVLSDCVVLLYREGEYQRQMSQVSSCRVVIPGHGRRATWIL